MTEDHPNVALLSKLDLRDLDASASLFSNDFVWHYFNPKLPEVEGDYVGVDGFKKFFSILAGKSKGTFKVEPISATPVGDELVVVRTCNSMELDDTSTAVDVVVIWRIVDGKFAEGWDIPSAFTMAAKIDGDEA